MPIFDQGYQHWSGHLSGHAWRWLAITRQGVRIGLKNKALRRVLFVAWLPAVALAAVLSIWGLIERKSELVKGLVEPLSRMLRITIDADPIHQRQEIWTVCFSKFMASELIFTLILVMLVGPNLVSQDLRFNAMPLYFSRPLRRFDYFVGKLGVIGAFVGMVMIVPALIAYLLGLLFSLDITIIGDTLPLLLSSIVYGAIVSISTGTLILALSSLTRNSRYVALLWIGVCFISFIVSSLLEDIEQAQRMRNAYLSRGSFSSPDQFAEEWLAASKTDWRPLISYPANLSRLGRQLLGTDAAWEKLAEPLPPVAKGMLLQFNVGSQHPWVWSAGVLIVILAISLCILNLRVRSLDRLK